MGDFSEHVLFGLLSAFVVFSLLEHSFSLTTPEVVAASVAVLVGSVIPDIDNKNAYIHRSVKALLSIISGALAFYLVPAAVQYRFLAAASVLILVWVSIGSLNVRHRGFTHSISFCMIAGSLLTIAGIYVSGSFVAGPALSLGVLSHLLLDGELKLS